MEAAPESHAGRRPNRFLSAALVVVAIVLSFAVASVVAPATPAHGLVEGVTLRVFPAASASLTPEGTLDVTVTITNGTDTAIAPGEVSVWFNRFLLDSREDVSDWLTPDNSDRLGTRIRRTPTAEILPGGTATVAAVPIPAASLGLGSSASGFGPRGIAAGLTVDDTEVAVGRGSVVWSPTSSFAPTNVTVLLPITTPATADGLIDAEALATFTEPTGILTQQLNAVISRPNTAIGLDPRILVSIRVLGSDAPPSALAWLERLGSVSNEIFPLAYADADLALQAQAGVPAPLTPTSVEYALDPARFEATAPADGANEETDGQDAAQTPSGASPTPTGTPEEPGNGGEEGIIPSLEQLLDWPYSRQGIGWPAPNTVTAPNLSTFASSGYTTTILDSDNVEFASAASPGPLADVNGSTILVSDSDLASLLDRAMSAVSDAEYRDAISRVASLLAVVTREQPGTTHAMVAALDRGWAPGQRVVDTLAAVSALDWANTTPLATALTGDVTTGALVDQPESTERQATATALLAAEASVSAFSIILERPELMTGEQRMRLLALLSVGWLQPTNGWTDAVTAHEAEVAEILASVRVSESSTLQIVGDNFELPVRVENDLDQPVTITVTGRALNARAEVEGSATITVPADATQLARLPARSVSNGPSTIAVTLYSSDEPGAVQIGEMRLLAAEIRAGWENVAIVILGVAVVLLFGFGIVRSILNRRRSGDVREGTDG